MIHSIATRKITAFLFAMAWLVFVEQGTSYGQPPIAEGKIYWTDPTRGIQCANLDGSNIEQLVKPELRYPADIALDVLGGKIYWTDEGRRTDSGWMGWGIYQSELDGSNLKSFPRGRVFHIALDVDGGKIYWTEAGGIDRNGIVARANLDGSNREVLFEGGPWEIALDLVRGKVYWTEGVGILRANLDGSDLEYDFIRTDLPNSSNIWEIALDVNRGKIYWTDEGTILRADLNGENREEILTISDGYPEEITLDVDRGKIYWANTYWTNPITRTIQRADLDGQNIEHLFELADDVNRNNRSRPQVGIALDVDRGKIYWTDPGSRTIQRADLNGENREVLFDPIVREPHGIALYSDKMYWTDVVKGTIQQSDLNGENIEVLVTGLNRPKGIALLDGDKIYWADAGTGEYWGYLETGRRVWVQPETGKIQAANWDGSNVKDVLTGLSYLEDIALDAIRGKIYWRESFLGETSEHTIQRADLDGSQCRRDPHLETNGVPLVWEQWLSMYWRARSTG